MSKNQQSESSTPALVVAGTTLAVSAAVLYASSRFWKTRHSSTINNEHKTVLIIGGGIGGLTAIAGLRKLDQHCKIVLVEPKDHVEIFWAAYRSPFEEWVREGSLIDLQGFCQENNVTHHRAIVTALSKTTAAFKSIQGDAPIDIDFDICVVATGAGSHWPGLGRDMRMSEETSTREWRLKECQSEGDRLLKAKLVVIVGGGLIGTELAGDLAGYAKKNQSDTKVTLIHSGTQLCPVMSSAAAQEVQNHLERLGVKVYLNEKAAKSNEGQLILKNSGTTIDNVEQTIWTIGFIPRNDFLANSNDFPNAVDDKGWIVTDEYFCIPGSDGTVFSIGDCTTTLPNAGNQVMRNVDVLGHNLKVALDNQDGSVDATCFKKVSHGPEAYCNTTGPDSGVFYCSLFWTQRILPWIKNKTMFFMSPKDMLGLKQ